MLPKALSSLNVQEAIQAALSYLVKQAVEVMEDRLITIPGNNFQNLVDTYLGESL